MKTKIVHGWTTPKRTKYKAILLKINHTRAHKGKRSLLHSSCASTRDTVPLQEQTLHLSNNPKTGELHQLPTTLYFEATLHDIGPQKVQPGSHQLANHCAYFRMRPPGVTLALGPWNSRQDCRAIPYRFAWKPECMIVDCGVPGQCLNR